MTKPKYKGAAAVFAMLLLLAFPSVIPAEDGSQVIPVTAEHRGVRSVYEYSLPAVITLSYESGNTYSAVYQVGLKGKIASDRYLSFAPTEIGFSVRNGAKTYPGTVQQEKERWATLVTDAAELELKEDAFTYATCTASVEVPGSGNYAGSLSYEILLREK